MGNCRDYPGALKFTLKLIKRVTRGKRNEFPISEPALVSAKTKIIGANLLFMNPWLEIFQAGLDGTGDVSIVYAFSSKRNVFAVRCLPQKIRQLLRIFREDRLTI